jgi:glycosyltransferase involved in cell wall biosynthesis
VTLSQEPLISVVIPAYNAERYIRQAIESVLAQTYSRLEVLVVDDGSTDGTADLVRAFAPTVRYIRRENGRQAAARNTGIRAATGEIVAFLDADDVWRPEKIEKQLALLRQQPELGLVYCSMIEIDPEGRELAVRRPGMRGQPTCAILLGQAGGGSGSTAIVPRRVLDKVGLFDEALPPCEDTEFLWRMSCDFPIDFVDEPLVGYRLHPGNDHKNVDKMAHAWTALYAKVLEAPHTKAEGWAFRRRCLARLYYMLAGDYALAGRTRIATAYALRAAWTWPPQIWRLLAAGWRWWRRRR